MKAHGNFEWARERMDATPGQPEGQDATKRVHPADALGLSKRGRKFATTIYLQEDEMDAVEKAAGQLKRPKTEIVRASIRIAMGMDPVDED